MNAENRALIFAPLMMPFAFIFYAFFTDVPGFNMETGILNFIASVVTVVIVGLPVVYLYEFFIGYRFYQLLVKKNRVNIFSLTLGAVIIADIPMFMILLAGGGGEDSLSTALQLFSFVGFMIGLTFWVLLNLDELRQKIGK
jgi:hypothetical protein